MHSLIEALLTTLITVIVAGTLGGTPCNLSGLSTQIRVNGGWFPLDTLATLHINGTLDDQTLKANQKPVLDRLVSN